MTLIPVALQSDIDTRASKSGDTFTGALTLQPAAGGFLTHDPSSFDSDAGVFRFTASAFANTTDARDNVVWRWGYNIADGGGRLDLTEPAISHEIESYWENPDGVTGLVMEAHLAFVDTAGTVHRPYSFMMRRDGTFIEGSLECAVLNIYDDDREQGLKLDFDNQALRFVKPLSIYQQTNNVALAYQRNAADSAEIPLPYINGSDKLLLGTSSQGVQLDQHLYLNGKNLLGDGTGTLQIGAVAGDAVNVNIFGRNSDVLRLRQVGGGDYKATVATANLSFVDVTNNRTLLRLSAGAPDKALVLTSAGRFSVGAGESPASLLHVAGAITLDAMTAPSDPSAGDAVLYHDTATGDVMVKINVGGTTKTATLVDYSALP